jgi:prepilin-type processing-associated H-X9-DG protein
MDGSSVLGKAFGSAGMTRRYFFSLDAFESYPQMILDSDDNLAVDGVRVKPGILSLGTNNIAWTKERHRGGNIGLADGSVQQATTAGLNSAVVSSTSGGLTNSAPNRWVIP